MKEFNKLIKKLNNKAYLEFYEKKIIKFFYLFKFLAKHEIAFDGEKSIRFKKLFKHFFVVKKTANIRGVNRQNWFCFYAPIPHNVFLSDDISVHLCSNGTINFYSQKKIVKRLELSYKNKSIFEDSLTINNPNKTIILNKNFMVKLYMSGKNLIVFSSQNLDFFKEKKIVYPLSKKHVFLLSNSALKSANVLLGNLYSDSTFAVKMPGRTLKCANKFSFIYLINNFNKYIDYLSLKKASYFISFFGAKIEINPFFYGGFMSHEKSHDKGFMLNEKINYIKYEKNSNFNIKYFDESFYFENYGKEATLKLPLLFGVYKIIKSKTYIKILNEANGFCFYINFAENMKLNNCFINSGNFIAMFSGNIKFNISSESNYKMPLFLKHTNLSLVENEICRLENIVSAIYINKNGFYSTKKYSEEVYDKLKNIIKEKQSLKTASEKLLSFCGQVECEKDKTKIYKIAGLLQRLPERKITISSLLKQPVFKTGDLNGLSLEEILELYKKLTAQINFENKQMCDIILL